MIRLFVDSGSSIKQEERQAYDVEILPLKIALGGREYLDGVDLSTEAFYRALTEEKQFPSTSLPSLGDTEERVRRYVEQGDEVLILTLSSGISGTYSALSALFDDEPRVRVIDTRTAVGGIRILVEEVNKYRSEPLDFIEEKLRELIPRIRIVAVPETLEYLYRGGRLSRTAWAAGSLLHILPLIGFDNTTGQVKVLGKTKGKLRAMQAVADSLVQYDCDERYPIIPSYTYKRENLDALIALTDERYKPQMTAYDNLTPAIACHWGPNGFGYMFVSKG